MLAQPKLEAPMRRSWTLLMLLPLFTGCGDKEEDDTGGSDDTGTTDDTGGTDDTGEVDDTGEIDDTGDTGVTDGVLAAGFEVDLTHESGCADTVLYANNDDDTLALHFVDGDWPAQAHAAGEAVGQSWDLSASQPVTLNVTVGTYLTHYTCNDAVEYEPVVTGTWVPNSGTLTLTVTPNGTPTDWDTPAAAVLEFSGVQWVPEGDPSGTAVPMGDFSIEAQVGWLPG